MIKRKKNNGVLFSLLGLGACFLVTALVFITLGCKNPLMDILEAPEIRILYNGQDIRSGSTLQPGAVEFGLTKSYEFTIYNKGRTGTLILSEDDPVTISSDFITMFALQPIDIIEIGPESGAAFIVTFTPFGSEGDKTVNITINNNDDDEGSFTFTLLPTAIYSVEAPTVTVSYDKGDATNLPTFEVTITFSAPVTGLTVDEIEVENGTADNLQMTYNNVIYTADVTASADPSTVVIAIPAGAVIDAGGRGNQASNSLSILYSTDVPSVAIDSDAIGYTDTDGMHYTDQNPIPVTITFDQAMTGVGKDDIEGTGGILDESSFTNVGGEDKVFSFDIIPSAEAEVVTVIVIAEAGRSQSTGMENMQSDDFEIIHDATGPGEITIGNDGYGYTHNTEVDLSISASDNASGIDEMILANNSDFSDGSWEAYNTARAWTIDGSVYEDTYTIYIKFRDNVGNESDASYDVTLTKYGVFGYSKFGEGADFPVFQGE